MNKNRWLIVALIASMGLNAALATRFLIKRRMPLPHSREARVTFPPSFVADRAQREKIDAILRRFRLDAFSLKEDILSQRVEILEELANPEYNPEKVKERVAELNQLENQMNNRFIDTLIQVSDILDSRQRLQMIYHLSRNWYFLNQFNEKGGQNE